MPIGGTSLGELDMGGSQHLVDVCQLDDRRLSGRALCPGAVGPRRRMAQRPEERKKTAPSPVKGACWDDTDGGDYLETREVGDALAAVPKNIDLFAYDACLMGMIECAYEVRSEASVFVASQELVPGDGWPYDSVLADLQAHPDWNASQFGSDIVTRYAESYGGGETLSAVKLAGLSAAYPDGLAAALDNLATAIINHADYGGLSPIADAPRAVCHVQRPHLPRPGRLPHRRGRGHATRPGNLQRCRNPRAWPTTRQLS